MKFTFQLKEMEIPMPPLTNLSKCFEWEVVPRDISGASLGERFATFDDFAYNYFMPQIHKEEFRLL